MSESTIDPFDVTALEKSLNDSAGRVSALWISFLIFALYLVVSAGTVTHEQLLLKDPVKLPVLNIDLPLVGFFFLAPILFLIFHAYMLLQVLLLGRTAAAYNEAVEHRTELAAPADNARVRQRLANTLFVQIFAGSPREREGWLGRLLKAMAWITLAIAPVLVLPVFQFKFLPYHSHLVTWTHRALILVDLAMVFLLWPLALDPKRDIEWYRVIRNPYALGSFALFAIFSLSLLTFPGEWHVNVLSGKSYNAVACRRWFQVSYYTDSPIYQEIQGRWRFLNRAELPSTDADTPIPQASPMRWQFFDRLDLPRTDIVDDEKLAKIVEATSKRKIPAYDGEPTRNLRGRDLNCIDVSDADLRRVDLTDASLIGGRLDRADLQGASLDRAQLWDASLKSAKLHGAALRKAKLQGAFLNSAKLYGAVLSNAQFQNASLEEAKLNGASLYRANLQGAYLYKARIRGARLNYAKLQGASLHWARLHGASFVGAKLNGASLVAALLQGADFNSSNLSYAVFFDASLWRAMNASCTESRFNDLEFPIRFRQSQSIEDFIEESIADIREPKMKHWAAVRMRAGLVVDRAEDDTATIERRWRECREASAKVSQSDFDENHAGYLSHLVCTADENRSATAKGIILNWISDDSDRLAFSAHLARGLLGKGGKPCAATEDLDEDDKRRLRAAIERAEAASSPKPEAKASGKPAAAPSSTPAPVSQKSTE